MAEKTKESDTEELRLRDFPKQTKFYIQAYREIVAVRTKKKPSITEAISEMVFYAYKKLSVEKLDIYGTED